MHCPADRAGLANMQHSPSSLDDPEVLEVNRHFVLGKCFCKDVGSHLLGGTICHSNLFVSYGLADEMVPNVDVFGACVVIVFGREM